ILVGMICSGSGSTGASSTQPALNNSRNVYLRRFMIPKSAVPGAKRKARKAEYPLLARASPPRGRSCQRIIRPGVLRISGSQVLANIVIRRLPEAGEVARHLDGSVGW